MDEVFSEDSSRHNLRHVSHILEDIADWEKTDCNFSSKDVSKCDY